MKMVTLIVYSFRFIDSLLFRLLAMTYFLFYVLLFLKSYREGLFFKIYSKDFYFNHTKN